MYWNFSNSVLGSAGLENEASHFKEVQHDEKALSEAPDLLPASPADALRVSPRRAEAGRRQRQRSRSPTGLHRRPSQERRPRLHAGAPRGPAAVDPRRAAGTPKHLGEPRSGLALRRPATA